MTKGKIAGKSPIVLDAEKEKIMLGVLVDYPLISHFAMEHTKELNSLHKFSICLKRRKSLCVLVSKLQIHPIATERIKHCKKNCTKPSLPKRWFFYMASNNFPGKGRMTPFNSIFNNTEEILKIGKSHSKAIISKSSLPFFWR